jgi:hypothetical protein
VSATRPSCCGRRPSAHIASRSSPPPTPRQAYNVFGGQSWYSDPASTTVELGRPYLDDGVPPHFRDYDEGLLRWFARAGKSADFITEDDLERFRSPERLAQLYD